MSRDKAGSEDLTLPDGFSSASKLPKWNQISGHIAAGRERPEGGGKDRGISVSWITYSNSLQLSDGARPVMVVTARKTKYPFPPSPGDKVRKEHPQAWVHTSQQGRATSSSEATPHSPPRKPFSTGTTQTDSTLCALGSAHFTCTGGSVSSTGLQALPGHGLWINLSLSLSTLVPCLEPHPHLASKLLPILQNPGVTGSTLLSLFLSTEQY